MNTTEYLVTGMTCGHCVKAVTEEVSSVPGVSEVKVSLEGGKMTITSQAPIELSDVQDAVSEAGNYQVALA